MSNKLIAGWPVLPALAALAAVLIGCAPQRASKVSPVIGGIDESNLVVLQGNTRPEIRQAQADLGRVADSYRSEHMLLQLHRQPAVEHELEQYIKDQQDPSSSRYHNWLSAKEYGDQFGIADEDIAKVTGWLTAHGLEVGSVSTSKMVIDFSGTAAQIRDAFHTELHAYTVKGMRHIANASDPQIPAALQTVVTGVVSLHDFRPHNNHKNVKPAYSAGQGYQLVVPGDLATIYNLNPLFDAGVSGQGQTIVVFEDTDVYTTEDWDTFRTKFGLDAYTSGTVTQVHPAPASGENNCLPPGVNGDESEAILDTQWASAAAPSAAIILASCSDTNFSFGGLLAMENMLNASATPPAVMSVSYGECETFNGAASNEAFKSVYQQGAAEGVSIFVSTGDEGAASCDANQSQASFGITVSGFASTPYNVAVGGTDFGDTFAGSGSTYWKTANGTNSNSAVSYVPEIPWSDSCASLLVAMGNHTSVTYGLNGFCNNPVGVSFLTTGSGSGGPSGCAVGNPATVGVVSGSCRGYDKPSWQTVYGNPSDGVRDLPDVSLFAADGQWKHYYVYCDTDPDDGTSCDGTPVNWPGAGGTSFASPILAGIQALVNQNVAKVTGSGDGRQGNPNPIYYQIANAEFGTTGNAACDSSKGNKIDPGCAFNDVTIGDIDVNCLGPYSCFTPSGTNGVLSTSDTGYGPAFAAHSGWDFATGLGTVNANVLVNHPAWHPTHSQIGWTPPHR